MSSITGPQALPPDNPQPLQYSSPIGVVSTAPDGLQFSDFMQIVQRRRILIIVMSFLFFVLSGAVTFVVYRFFPAFPSEAFFELQPPKTGAFIQEGVLATPQQMGQLLTTEARKLQSLSLLLQVVEAPEFKQTRYFDWYENNASKAAYGLRDDLAIAPIRDSQLLRLMLSTRSAEESELILKLIVDRYQRRFQSTEREDAQVQLDQIRSTLDRRRQDLQKARLDASRFRETADVPAQEGERGEKTHLLAQFRADLALIQTEMSRIESEIESLAGYDPDTLPLTSEQRLLIESDPLLRFYMSQTRNLDIELQVALMRLGDGHPDVQRIIRRRQLNYDNEVSRREELIDRVRSRQYENLRQRRAHTRNALEQRQSQISEIEAQARDLDRSLSSYREMQADITLIEEQIRSLEEARIEAAHRLDDNRPRLILVQPPTLAVEPSRPKLRIYLGAGAFLSILAAVGLAFLVELSDTTVRTPIDVVRHAHMSVLGTIPMLDDEEADVDEIEQAVAKAPQSLVAEAFRRVNTNLQFSGPPEWQRTLLITSARPEDGKTAVAVNMARTLANGGHRVLLIDCNFRRPALHRIFGQKRDEGLSNLLIGEGHLDDYLLKTDSPNLDVLCSGRMPPTPTELLGSQNMRKLLTEAIEKYDRVLLDGPPALLISDAGVLASQVDGVIVVSFAEKSSKGVLRRAKEALERINARIVGVVLNGAKARSGGYFRQQYREFYDYTSDETIAELPEPKDIPEDKT